VEVFGYFLAIVLGMIKIGGWISRNPFDIIPEGSRELNFPHPLLSG
jgi:hypothetical protein